MVSFPLIPSALFLSLPGTKLKGSTNITLESRSNHSHFVAGGNLTGKPENLTIDSARLGLF